MKHVSTLEGGGRKAFLNLNFFYPFPSWDSVLEKKCPAMIERKIREEKSRDEQLRLINRFNRLISEKLTWLTGNFFPKNNRVFTWKTGTPTTVSITLYFYKMN